ncbi:MAG: hypothetical protein GYA46_14790 [candidate division Zixibacteria bacterium]|nr:hypothetical protein [candidate division Zixibacteria bacterium]
MNSKGSDKGSYFQSLVSSGTPLGSFLAKIANLSNSEFPFLHTEYSPASRIPCADITPFIIDRLRKGDVASIRQMMRAIIADNPGLGLGQDWINEEVDEIVHFGFERYCKSSDPEFQFELKALFIVCSKNGGGREFWLADNTPFILSLALCCHRIEWQDAMEKLREKANRFIERMRTEAPFWKKYPLFADLRDENPNVGDIEIVARTLKALPLMSRVHLISLAKEGGGSLMRSPSYVMRSMGLNPIETASILKESNLLDSAAETEMIASAFSKDELMAILDEKSIQYRKSWKKIQMVEALGSGAPSFIRDAVDREAIVRIKPEIMAPIQSLYSSAIVLQEYIKLLCFA